MNKKHHTNKEEIEGDELIALFNDAKERIAPPSSLVKNILDAIPATPHTPAIKSPYSRSSDRLFQLAARTPWKIAFPIAVVFLMLVSIGAGGKREDPLALNASLGMQESAVLPMTFSSAEDVSFISPTESAFAKHTIITAPLAEPTLAKVDDVVAILAHEADTDLRVATDEGDIAPRTDVRLQWDGVHDAAFATLAAHAQTSKQRRAVATFKAGVDAAVALRRDRVDRALNTFHANVNDLHAARSSASSSATSTAVALRSTDMKAAAQSDEKLSEFVRERDRAVQDASRQFKKTLESLQKKANAALPDK